VNLGLALAQARDSVVMVNADVRRPKLGALVGGPPMRGLSSVLLEDVSLASALHHHATLLLETLDRSPPPPDPGERQASSRLLDLIESLEARADIVPVDTPALLPAPEATSVAQAVAGRSWRLVQAPPGPTWTARPEPCRRSGCR
jgi:Mrp family chromosome partitioning ATPase